MSHESVVPTHLDCLQERGIVSNVKCLLRGRNAASFVRSMDQRLACSRLSYLHALADR